MPSSVIAERAVAAAQGLPVVDLSRFRAPEPERAAFLRELREILRDHGFFYLIGHGVSGALTREIFAAAKSFFALSPDRKLEIEMVRSPHFRGYNRPGLEHTRGKPDWREQLDVNSERAAPELTPSDPPWRRLIGPNQWPEGLPGFRETVLEYQAEATRVGVETLRAISAALVGSPDAFADIYTPAPTQLLKLIRYPGRDVAQSSQGVGAHKDGGLVTVLLQDEVGGLRVQTPEGEWIEAPHVPGAFVINTGEVLELATDGYVCADVHDVVAPPPGVERHSIAFFLGARLDAVVPRLDLPPELRARARGVTADPLNPLFREVGRNHLKSRLRSHPDVARRHHADLLTAEELAGPARAQAY